MAETTPQVNLKKIPAWAYIVGGAGLIVVVYIIIQRNASAGSDTVVQDTGTDSFLGSGFSLAIETTKDLINAVDVRLSEEIEALQLSQSDVAAELLTLGQADTALGAKIDAVAASAKAELKATTDTINTTLAAVTNRVLALEQFKANITPIVEQTKTLLGQQVSKIANLEALANSFKSSITNLTSGQSVLTAAVTQARGQINAVMAQMAGQQRDITNTSNALNAMGTTVWNLQNQVNAILNGQYDNPQYQALLQLIVDAARNQIVQASGGMAYWRNASTDTIINAVQGQSNLLAGQPIGNFLRSLYLSGGVWRPKPAEVPLPGNPVQPAP